MQSNILECCVCLVSYNSTNKLPKLVPSCGHTMCLECLEAIINSKRELQCPLDRIQFMDIYNTSSSFPTNRSLLQLLDEKPQPKFETCSAHDDAINLICLTDGKKICRYCVDFGDHKGHKVKHINDLQSDAQKKVERLNGLIKKLEETEENENSLIGEVEKMMIYETKQGFQGLRELLEKKEEEVCKKIESYAAKLKAENPSEKEDQLNLIKNIKEAVTNLSNLEINASFLEAYQAEEKWGDDIVSNKKVNSFPADYHKKFQTHFVNMAQLLSSIVQEYQPQLQTPVIQKKQEPKVQIPNNMGSGKSESEWLNLLCMRVEIDRFIINPKSPQMMKPLHSGLILSGNHKGMKKLTIDGNGVVFGSDSGTAIQYALKYLGNIEDLKLVLSTPKLTDLHLYNFISVFFLPFENLKSFELDIYGGNVSDQSIQPFMSKILVQMKGLKSLKLRLSETNITNISLEAFSHVAFPLLKDLENLDIRVVGTKVNDDSVTQLMQALPENFKSGKSLILGLAGTGITSISLESFNAFVLPRLRNLENLELYLGRTQINTKVVNNLYHCFKEFGKNLTNLVLGFEDTEISETSFNYLGSEIIPNLKSLKNIAVHVGGIGLGKGCINFLRGSGVSSKISVQVTTD